VSHLIHIPRVRPVKSSYGGKSFQEPYTKLVSFFSGFLHFNFVPAFYFFSGALRINEGRIYAMFRRELRPNEFGHWNTTQYTLNIKRTNPSPYILFFFSFVSLCVNTSEDFVKFFSRSANNFRFFVWANQETIFPWMWVGPPPTRSSAPSMTRARSSTPTPAPPDLSPMRPPARPAEWKT